MSTADSLSKISTLVGNFIKMHFSSPSAGGAAGINDAAISRYRALTIVDFLAEEYLPLGFNLTVNDRSALIAELMHSPDLGSIVPGVTKLSELIRPWKHSTRRSVREFFAYCEIPAHLDSVPRDPAISEENAVQDTREKLHEAVWSFVVAIRSAVIEVANLVSACACAWAIVIGFPFLRAIFTSGGGTELANGCKDALPIVISRFHLFSDLGLISGSLLVASMVGIFNFMLKAATGRTRLT